jgi:hypothetical protein
VQIRVSLTGRFDRSDVGLQHRALPTPSGHDKIYILVLFFVNGFCQIKPDEVSRSRDADMNAARVCVCP